MKRLYLIFGMLLISVSHFSTAHAFNDLQTYIDPDVAQKTIEKHFSYMATRYLDGAPKELDNNAILLNVVDVYNNMLKQTGGFVSVSGINNVCKAAFVDYEKYAKGNTPQERKLAFRNKCMAFYRDLSSFGHAEINTDCPYDITKVGGSQAKIKYMLPDKSGFIREGGSIAWRFFNPGNLRGSNLKCTTIQTKPNGTFAVFPNAETGQLALHNLLANNPEYQSRTVAQAIYKYAPPKENNTKRYINNLRNAGINVDAKLSSLSDAQMQQLEEMIMIIEGWEKIGTETHF